MRVAGGRGGGSSPLARGLRSATPRRAPAPGDHPRSRGVYNVGDCSIDLDSGSSPLARGLPSWSLVFIFGAWIIPARAGFTSPELHYFWDDLDHPRSRGVYSTGRGRPRPTRGSSPLARGLRRGPGARPDPDRIIPARAGFTPGRRRPRRRGSDHPRSRGVYSRRLFPRTAGEGSSPLARGLHATRQVQCQGTRIIPARAGFTSTPLRAVTPRLDHPRSRGVYVAAMRAIGNSVGIIPARAGFTGQLFARVRGRRDHPRSRGVYDGDLDLDIFHGGSSPLARGLRPHGEAGARALRIIPARAGFTMLAPPTPPDWGSSPLARGLPRERAHRRDPHRIIPARAGFTAGYAGCRWDAADHPRSRGVYRRPRRGPQRDRGIIPARAGFTGGRRPQEGDEGDHPRSRGVYAAYAADSGPDYGSSPLARGLPGSQGRQGGMNRIIPARAGFTRPALLNCLPWRDHPRSRGVYGWTVLSSAATPGSSPLARGLRPGPSGRRPGPRIIPARAGFTPVHLVNPLQREDHPRSRGVYTWRNWMRNAAKGSSPLARGLPQTASSASVSLRIIPARAGFTRSGSPRGAPAGDHPRSRGVYSIPMRKFSVRDGSSPLARGLRRRTESLHVRARIIPARAGFTGWAPRTGAGGSDHPRSRGVYAAAAWKQTAAAGSSPLARGLLLCSHRSLW